MLPSKSKKNYPVYFLPNQNVWAIFFLLFCCYACTFSPRTGQKAVTEKQYFVDAIKGDDAHTGHSPKQAWKTLAKVNSHVFEPGDKLLFKSGTTYEGQLKIQGAGTKNKLIIIDQYGKGAKPQLNAKGKHQAALLLYNTQYIGVNNLAIANQGENREAKRYGVQVELSDFGTAHNIALRNLEVHDVNGSLVKQQGGGAGIIFINGGRTTPSRFDGVLVENCSIKNCARNGLLINGNWQRSRWFPNLNVVIRRNLIQGVPGDGIVPTGCDGALIEHNVMRDCPRLLPRGEAAAGIWPWSCDNTLIQYNEVSDHKAPWDGQGFDSDWNCRNTLIQYNYSHDNEGGFLLVCNDGSSPPTNNVGNVGSIIRYNVSINDGHRTQGQHAGFSPVIHVAGPTRNTRIYNNLIYVTRRSAGMDSTLINLDTWHGYADSTLFANNIFYVAGGVKYLYGQSSRNFFQNNLYFGRHHSQPHDPNGILAAPGFKSGTLKENVGFAALTGFGVVANAPVVGKGLPLVTTSIKDFFGNPVVPGQNPSIGIHEPAR
ncbi:right-handed parallel beta-helix repeat-containing protein [Adhaeribacter rhizoryzae]|uniref:Right-handed parallel beta-helix repeat-containing protein n=1 Tax=Adhaeribacter rhizoryzae TaxID=2607907 RepID=A0A5M6DNU2_9BACT|nr:right-handed parallel beta-helix repeat-containing protein [Adhaeribacter rhizoryzae]KAA5549154.1 right-handed parallel beta-helix repeat-containing protein [Adhaeribacter rhizoryzae]